MAGIHARIVSKHVEELKQKLKEKNRSFIEGADLQVFKELCTHEDVKIRGIACKSVTKLVRSNMFPLQPAMSWFISILQSNLGSNQDGIICAITDLLLMSDAKHWGGFSAQHPFVLALKQNEENWSIIEYQMDIMFKMETRGNSQRAFSLLIPVFQYILWTKNTVSALCRRATWKCLIENFHSENFDFLIETISWLSTDDRYSTLDLYHFLCHYDDQLDAIMKRNNGSDIICVYYAHTSCKLAQYGYDPTSVLQITRKLARETPATVNIVLALFAQTMTRCPIEFLNTFLVSCVELIEYGERTCGAIKWLVISAVLPWLLHSSSFTEDIHKTAEKLFYLVYHDQNQKRNHDRNETLSSSLISDESFIRVVISEEEIYWAFVTACSLEESNHDEFFARIDEFEFQVEEVARCPLLHLSVSAILLSANDFNIQSRALSILLDLNAEFYLPHVLYLLTKTTDPKLQLKLLHSLPLTAVEKENVRPVLRSIDSFFSSGKSVLTNLSIKLYSTLWKIEERCYSYLHDRLLEYEELPSNNTWQKDVILASTIRDICASKPDKYGQEWISILNQVIKRWYQKKDGSLPTVLALDAIICLCRAEVLQVIGIYKMLSERLFDDSRVQVTKKFHALIRCMFEATNIIEACIEVKQVVLHAVSRLLLVVSSSTHDEIVESALNALSKFDKNEMDLRVVPNEFKKLVKLPPESALKSVKSVNEGDERQPQPVPGNIWIWLWQNVQPQAKSYVSDMLMCWLIKEVENFPKSLYGSIRGEPNDLKILHDKCLFKTLVNYLKSNSRRSDSLSEDDLETSVMCLKLLNGNLPKTLPLFNWTFLLLLIRNERSALNEQIITLFAKQCCTSSSARVSMEDYLGNFHATNNEDDMKVVLNVLTDLCRGISTVVLKNFLDLVENYVSEKSNEGETLLNVILDRFSETLRRSDIDENNRICISEFAKKFWEKTSYEDAVFKQLLNVAVKLPSTYVDNLCSYDEDQLSPLQVCKIIELQCAMAMKVSHQTPFDWLQKSIELTALFPEKQEFYFMCSLPVMKKYRTHSSCWPWLMQFTAYVHSITDKLSKSGIHFVYNTMIFTVVSLSVYESFVSIRFTSEDYVRFFPQALNSIVITQNKSSSQIIDWLFTATKSSILDQRYKTLFYYTLVCLKNDKYLSKMSVRGKILSS